MTGPVPTRSVAPGKKGARLAAHRRARSPALRSLLLLGAAGIAQQAPAQSGLVVYGNFDLGIAKSSGQALRIDRGYNNWLGLKGNEMLGGGWSATFQVEARFNPDTGRQERSGTLWQGETTVGLRRGPAGRLRLGRALTPLWHHIWKFEPWANSAFNASLSAYQTGSYSSDGVNDVERDFADFSRMSNGIYYESPDLSGLSLHAAAGVERAAGADARAAGAALNYAGAQLGALLSYERNTGRDAIRFLALSWRFGKLTLMGSHAWNSLRDRGSERAMLLAGIFAFGAGKLRMGYGRNPALDSHKASLGYVHSLSPRTNVYADLYREHAMERASGAALGINHTF